MDLLRLPMKGGAVDFGGTYEFIPLQDIKNNIQNNINLFKSPTQGKGLSSATFIMKDISGGYDYPTNIQSIDKITDRAIFSNVIGISWYAAMKLMNEFVDLGDETGTNTEKISLNSNVYKDFASKFFNLSDKESDRKPQNFAKAAIIGFVHGVHAYKLATSPASSKIPTITDTILDRYNYVLDTIKKLEGDEKATITGIWQALVRFNVKTTENYNEPITVLSEAQKLQDFLAKTEPNNKEEDDLSVDSDEDLDDIAFAFDIHEALLNFSEEAE